MNGFDQLLAELQSSRLEVVLVPSRRYPENGGCIRVAAAKNCRWYREFCARHLSSRRRSNTLPDTRIRRAGMIALLERLAAGSATRSKYAPELTRLARRLELQSA